MKSKVGTQIAAAPAQPVTQYSPLQGGEFRAEYVEQGIDFLRLLRIIRKRIWLILGFAIAVAGFIYVMQSRIVPMYRAAATLIIEPKETKLLSINDFYGVDTAKDEYLQTQFEIMKSRSLSRRVVEQLGLIDDPEFATKPPKKPNFIVAQLREWGLGTTAQPVTPAAPRDPVDRVVDAVQERLIVAPVRSTQVVKISFDATNPDLAMRVANSFGEEYIEATLDARLHTTKEAATWLSSRLEGLRGKLAVAERNLQQYLERENLVDLDPEKNGVVTVSAAELSETNTRFIDARRSRLEAETLYRQVTQFGDNLYEHVENVPAVFQDPLVQQLKQRENEAAAKVSDLEQRYGSRHPERISAETDLRSARAALRRQVTSVVRGIKNQYDAARANEAALARSVQQVKSNIQSITRKQGQLEQYRREVESNRKLYDLFFNRYKEASEAEDLKTSNARVVDRAEIPTLPFKPNKKIAVILAFILSFSAAAALAIMMEHLDKSFKNPDDVEERLGLPLLGLVPLQKRIGKRDPPLPQLFFDPTRPTFSEALRTIRTGILLSGMDNPHKLLLVTSSLAGEGKTTVAVSLAYALGQVGRVLLIDADLRRPSIGKIFGIDSKVSGLSNLVAQAVDPDMPVDSHGSIFRFDEGNIDVLPAGMILPNPLELLSSWRFAEILAQFEERYDAIVIDAPPTLPVSDALVLAQFAHSVVYVVKAGKTPANVVEAGLARLRRADAGNIGVVLNRFDIDKARKYGGYHPGYYGEGYAHTG